ncbi:alpha/beta fold hydrolase [Nocardioides sp. T2.26MG-1]|uniref:alpha/beta fold hydrolase n=1 Tax=Nocardioides sp. T2.26MG-1 TaxID=3041166 RepID=UPI0024775425|nr:alpha/beta hydrolase [Nocardioides sp. T2.26MG-1]CAI9419478.1 Haloalkane dehalogenase 2 [Nocardioides sp. T2.26MG-1]
MPQHTIDLPTGTLHYREAGPADGPVVVLVHGFLVDDTLWADIPERLADRGLHTLAPTWPLGAHRTAMSAGADLSPRGIARIVVSFLDRLGLTDVTLVGNDTGGAVSQLVLDEDPSRVARVVLTNCDAFDTFPPFPFNLLFRLARHPWAARAVLQTMRPAALRNSPLGFGWLVKRPLTAAETRGWLAPYLSDAGVRRDVAAFARAWRASDLAEADTWLPRFTSPVLLCWAPEDRFFRIGLAHRLAETLPDARLVEIPDARAFVALDQPARLADEIAGFVGVGAGS